MAFIFNANPIITKPIPSFSYSVEEATEYEVCNRNGIRLGSRLRLKDRLNTSPQSTGSIWVIKRFRPDIDEYTIQPVDSKMQFSARTCPLADIKANFIILNDLNNNKVKL